MEITWRVISGEEEEEWGKRIINEMVGTKYMGGGKE